MIDPNLYREFLLSHIPGAKPASGNKEVVIRCRYCPDSRDMKKAHMYLNIPYNKDDVPYYSIHKKTFADRGKSIRHCEGMIYFHYTDYF